MCTYQTSELRNVHVRSTLFITYMWINGKGILNHSKPFMHASIIIRTTLHGEGWRCSTLTGGDQLWWVLVLVDQCRETAQRALNTLGVSECVWVSVFEWVCVSECVCEWVSVFEWVCVWVSVSVCVCVCLSECVCVWVSVCVSEWVRVSVQDGVPTNQVDLDLMLMTIRNCYFDLNCYFDA